MTADIHETESAPRLRAHISKTLYKEAIGLSPGDGWADFPGTRIWDEGTDGAEAGGAPDIGANL